jgi:hypothetical protein
MTNEKCDMEWKERGWSGKNANTFVGLVKTASGDPRFRIQGKFTEVCSIVDLSDENCFEE